LNNNFSKKINFRILWCQLKPAGCGNDQDFKLAHYLTYYNGFFNKMASIFSYGVGVKTLEPLGGVAVV